MTLGKTISKALVAGLLTGVMALTAAAPAVARDGYDDRHRGRSDRRDHDWRGDNPQRAIEMCSRVAERSASRRGHGRANVTDIRDVRETRWGYEVRGRIAINGWSRWGGSYRSGDRRWSAYDDGSFKCRVENGRIADLDISGIRGL